MESGTVLREIDNVMMGKIMKERREGIGMNVLYSEFGDPKYRPNILLKQMVAANKLGMKTGEGFFVYNK